MKFSLLYTFLHSYFLVTPQYQPKFGNERVKHNLPSYVNFTSSKIVQHRYIMDIKKLHEKL